MAGTSLEYAPRPPVYRRRAVRRVVWMAVLACVGLVGYLYRKPVWEQGRLLYWQHKAATYAPAADFVVYEDDPAIAAELLKRPGYFNITNYSRKAAVAGYVAPELTGFGGAQSAVSVSPGLATVFLHERVSRQGHKRIVLIQGYPQNSRPLYAPFELEITLIRPATLRGTPEVMPSTANRMGPIDIMSRILPEPNLRLYAGQADPKNSARFTIRYEMIDPERPGAVRAGGTIEGVLAEDGSHVSLRVIDGPAKPPSAWGVPLLPDP